MGEQINYTFMPSLERLALIKTATILWNQDDTRGLIVEVEIHLTLAIEKQKELHEIEEKVEEKVHELPLPESLKKRVSDFIKPIGFEIFKWKAYIQSFLPVERCKRLVRESLNKLCWTSQGTVDRKETVQALIKDESLDITERYTLACIYCLKNDILTLWSKMPENCRRSYYSSKDPRVVNQEKLVLFWTLDMCDDELRRISFGEPIDAFDSYQHAFQYAVSRGNKVATEYFLQKLTSEERELCLNSAAIHTMVPLSLQDTYILHFLLSQMTKEQRLEVLKEYPYEMLESLLDWPTQGSFLEMLKHLCAFLSGYEYNSLLEAITDKVIYGYKDYNYQNLFRESWQQIPVPHKELIIKECASGPLLFNLFQVKDIENIKLILEDATITEREKIIFSNEGKSICKNLFYDDKMDLLEFFVRECISSKDVMIKLKEEFQKQHKIYLRCLVTQEKKEDKWNEFCQFFDDLIQTYD